MRPFEQHFANVLENRADKRWTPNFFACADIAAAYSDVLGYPITSDPYVEPFSIELRTETGTLCAKINRVPLPETN